MSRYPEIEFNTMAVRFMCPRCSDSCNCTVCSRKRGEEYVPERKGGYRALLDLEPAPRIGRRPPGERPNRQRRSLRPSPSVSDVVPTMEKPKKLTKKAIQELEEEAQADLIAKTTLSIPAGHVWGAVFGPDGRRVGVGVVGSEGIVIKPAFPTVREEPSVSLQSQHSGPQSQYIGLHPNRPHEPFVAPPPEPLAPGVKMSIGSQWPLTDLRYKSLGDHIADLAPGYASDGSLSSLTSLESSDDENDAPGTAMPYDVVELAFVVAQALQALGITAES